MFEQAGIEFMTPDELIRSLGAGGLTPDEIQEQIVKPIVERADENG